MLLAMISVRRQVSQAFLNLTGSRKQLTHGQHEPESRAHNMVVSSRSSRGRRTVQTSTDSEQHDELNQSDSNPQSPLPSHDALPTNAERDDASSSRSKRSRIASVSDQESIQKRRRLERASGLPHVHIPLRGRAAPDSPPQSLPGSVARNTAVLPPLVSHDSSINDSPLNSPAYGPQYDQFKKIEERAQKVVRKSIHNEGSKDDKRTLRSEHGSTRSKTELAQYFPAFDDMLSLEATDTDLLTANSPVVLVNDIPSFQILPEQPDFFQNGKQPHDAEIIPIEQFANSSPVEDDPLADAVYLKAHQKAERHEKQMKNGDKERAQHEKYQLEHLLEELRGPDWLKTLGISGITDGEKKRYEVKRALFIRETKALIDKFRRWKEEEKRRKSEKQQRLLEEAETAQSVDLNSRASSIPMRKSRPRILATSGRKRSRTTSRPVSIAGDKAPDSRELDDLASQQLLEEAKLATLKHRKTSTQLLAVQYFPEFSTPRPFTSFFEKEHIRDAVISGRNRGRKSYAFGIEVPEMLYQEFELPDGILTDDTIRASQRMRRRTRRSLED